MIIATRTLRIMGDDGDVEVPVTVHMPAEENRCWGCDFEIGWPRQPFASRALGVDGVQALQLAMFEIGIMLEASKYHRAGLLIFEDNDPGYGFPIELQREAGRDPVHSALTSALPFRPTLRYGAALTCRIRP